MANSLFLNGEPLGIRTPDPLIKSRKASQKLLFCYKELVFGECNLRTAVSQ